MFNKLLATIILSTIFLATLVNANGMPANIVFGYGAALGSFSMVTGTGPGGLFEAGDGDLAIKLESLSVYRNTDCQSEEVASLPGTSSSYSSTGRALPTTENTPINPTINLLSGSPNYLVKTLFNKTPKQDDCAKYIISFQASNSQASILANGSTTLTINCIMNVSNDSYTTCSSISPSSSVVMTKA